MSGASHPVLFIGHRWPEPQATAAGQRILQLIEAFTDSGAALHFATAARPGLYPADLEKLGVSTHQIRMNDSGFESFIKDYQFEMVVFDRFLTEEAFGWRVRSALPECRLVLDTEDLHSLRYSRETAFRKGREWSERDWVNETTFPREVASILRCDLSLLISEEEKRLLLRVLPLLEPLLAVVPFGMPISDKPTPSFEERRDFVFLGNGHHKPNLEAIRELHREIWPELSKQCPGAECCVYGAYLPESIMGLDHPEARFRVKGWVPETKEVLSSARLQVAPLRFGAGVKGKVLEGLKYGLPSLTSEVGAEGIYNPASPAQLLSDRPQDFVEKAAALYSSASLWNAALQSATERSGFHFASKVAARDRILDALYTSADPSPISETAILQRLLRDSAFDRLRFMSRWIEAKKKMEAGNS